MLIAASPGVMPPNAGMPPGVSTKLLHGLSENMEHVDEELLWPICSDGLLRQPESTAHPAIILETGRYPRKWDWRSSHAPPPP